MSMEICSGGLAEFLFLHFLITKATEGIHEVHDLVFFVVYFVVLQMFIPQRPRREFRKFNT